MYPTSERETKLPLFSYEAARTHDGAGYWSNEQGWVSIEDATRFSELELRTGNRPITGANDTVWLADRGLRYMVLSLIEDPGFSVEPILFECVAEDREHAIDQAKNAYPNCIIMG